MKNILINKSAWKVYFDNISKYLLGQQVEVEIVGLDVGDQIEEGWILLEGLSYNTKDNILFVHTAKTDHSISEPLQVLASEDGAFLNMVVVKNADGLLEILKFRRPILLEASRSDSVESPVGLY